MNAKERLAQIREAERISHTETYRNQELFESEGWLKKPIKAVVDVIPMFQEYEKLRVLDLGCGVGRNCIPIAQEYTAIDCEIDCVDLLELAIDKLNDNADKYQVSSAIKGNVMPLEQFEIKPGYYDFIMAISALEHIESKEFYCRKLSEIAEGIKNDGVACILMNSEISETDSKTGKSLEPQFEINLATTELQKLLEQYFEGWNVLRLATQKQTYEIPREDGMVRLETNVVTYVAQK